MKDTDINLECRFAIDYKKSADSQLDIIEYREFTFYAKPTTLKEFNILSEKCLIFTENHKWET